MRVNSRKAKDDLLDWNVIVFRVVRSVLVGSVLVGVTLIVPDLLSFPFGIARGSRIQVQGTRSGTDFVKRRVDLAHHDEVVRRVHDDLELVRVFRVRESIGGGRKSAPSCMDRIRFHVNCTISCEVK